MESYQLAKANIKILDMYYDDTYIWVRFSYQWRDKHRQPQWAEDVVSLLKRNKYTDEFGVSCQKLCQPEDVRKAVYQASQEARAKLETREA